MSAAMRKTDIVVGGHAGPWGRMYVWCQEALLGMLYDDPDDTYTVMGKLLDRCEERWGEPVVAGQITERYDTMVQGEAITDDARVELPPKVKRGRTQAEKRGKRHMQQYTVPGVHEPDPEPGYWYEHEEYDL